MNIGKYLAKLQGQLNPAETMSLESYLVEIVLKLISTGQSAEISQLQVLAAAAGDTDEANFFASLLVQGSDVSTDSEVSGAGYQTETEVNSAITSATEPLDSRISALEGAPAGGFDPSVSAEMFDTFLQGTSNTGYPGLFQWAAYANNAGKSYGIGESRHPGILVLETGTNPGGEVEVALGTPAADDLSPFIFGGGAAYIGEWLVKIPTLSDGTDTFLFAIGFSDTTNPFNYNTSAAVFVYSTDISPNWITDVANASGNTQITSSIPVTTGWTKLRIECNADGTSLVMKVNGVVVATNTTNIATDYSTSAFGVSMAMVKSLGTNSRTALIDYSYVKQTFAT